jgi:pimeloyl-ACP methyl ester carboxylesterase
MKAIYKSAEGARLIRERYLDLLRRWPVPNQHLRVPTREGETFIVACGPTDAPPLLLFQGSGANAAMWMRDVATWAEHFRVYAVDTIGEPGMSATSRPPLGSDAYSMWLDDVMAALSIERASMVGVSLGGWLVLDFATRRPHRVESVVVINPAGLGKERLGFMLKALPLLLLGRWGRRKAMQMAIGPSPAAPTAADFETGAFAALIFKHFRPRIGRKPRFDREALEKLEMPVLLIAGAQDAMLDADDTRRRLEEAVPHATICFLPEAGHLIRDQASRILDFLCEATGVSGRARQSLAG